MRRYGKSRDRGGGGGREAKERREPTEQCTLIIKQKKLSFKI